MGGLYACPLGHVKQRVILRRTDGRVFLRLSRRKSPLLLWMWNEQRWQCPKVRSHL
jgi:hypothetical protein